MWTHWVARANHPYEPFRRFEDGRYAWASLMRLFPEAISAVLMPNHVHLIVADHRTHAQNLDRLYGWLGSVSRRKRTHQLWQSVPDPREINDRGYLLRTIRYVALNPCRKRLCRDPAEWYWSTYRETLGASVGRQNVATQLARALAERSQGFSKRLYQYISADATVQSVGAGYPTPVPPSHWCAYSGVDIRAAAAAALRVAPEEIRKRGAFRPLCIHLAMRQGWTRPGQLAELCGISRESVRRHMNRPPPAGLEAAALCLGDRRFRVMGETCAEDERGDRDGFGERGDNATFEPGPGEGVGD